MKPKDDQLKVKRAYEHDQVPEWWDAEPTHEELLAAEIDSQRHHEHESKTMAIDEALKKVKPPF